MSWKYDTRTKDFSVVIQSESVYSETINKIDHPSIVLIKDGHSGLAGTLVRSLLLNCVIWSIKMSPGDNGRIHNCFMLMMTEIV